MSIASALALREGDRRAHRWVQRTEPLRGDIRGMIVLDEPDASAEDGGSSNGGS